MKALFRALPLLPLLIVGSCSKNDGPRSGEGAPTLAQAAITIAVGEQRDVAIEGRVSNASLAEAAESIVEAWVDTRALHLRGLSEGSASVTVSLDGVRRVCRVTVTAADDDEEKPGDDILAFLTPAQHKQLDNELANPAPRIVVPEMASLLLATPGTLFVAQGSLVTSLRGLSLQSGEEALIECAGGLAPQGGDWKPLEDLKISLMGNVVPLASAFALRDNATGVVHIMLLMPTFDTLGWVAFQ